MESKHYNKIFRMKTQKAIQIVNHYENHHSELAKISLLYGYSHLQQSPPKPHKQLEHCKWKKLQFIDHQCKLFKFNVSHLKPDLHYILKLVFKDFSGSEIIYSLSSRAEPIPVYQCEQKVKGQKIIKISQLFTHTRGLFITFHSLQMTFFKFKYEFQLQQKSSFKLERTQSEQKIKIPNLPNIPSQSLQATQSLLFTLKTQRSMSSSRIMNRQKSPKAIKREELISARLKSIETQKQKMTHAKQRKHDISLYKQKYQQLKIVADKCKGLLQQFEMYNEQRLRMEQKNVQVLAKLIIVVNFLQSCHFNIDIQSERIHNATKFRKVMMKAAFKFMKIHKEIKRIIPNPVTRQLITIKHLATQQAVLLHNLSFKKSGHLLMDCLMRVSPRIIVNKLLLKATQYRAKIRTIQKYWIIRNKSQLMCFEDYINYQLLDILKKNPNFQPFTKQFYQEAVQKQLSWTYLKESSQKLKGIVGSYLARLEEIREIKEANIEITQFNKKALKKHQKNYLIVPRVPPNPITRYFRDIQILKSMVRTWFQIEYRKYIRKNSQNKNKNKSLKKL